MAPAFMFASVALAGTSIFLWLRLRAARRTEFIRTFTLPTGLYEKLQKHHPHLSTKDCQIVSRGLRQFFLAYLASGRRYVSMPSQVADDLWHEFILDTRAYERFCRTAFGRFLHHTPAAALRANQQSNAGLRRCWWHTCREELIDPRKAKRLPLLFALDAKFNIAGGFHYVADCSAVRRKSDSQGDGGTVYCGGDFADASIDGDTDGFDSGGSDGGDGGCGGGCGGD